MTKRKKITLTLTALIAFVGMGAQFYTNYKVDQLLQNFPYSLDNQAILNVTESNKNFLSRELTFSVQDSDGAASDIISAKLTALPFFITAESKLSDQFVRRLNKSLNIALDKNTINSKFSPVGDYLQSDISMEFRDFANKPQQMTMSLNFLNDNEIELKTRLSGFNYDKESRVEKIEGRIRLMPVSSRQYDLVDAEFMAENAELVLLNGENTRLQLKNATYVFSRKNDENNQAKRNLNTKFSSDILRISNKNRITEESQTTFGGLNLTVNQYGVASSINFYDEFKKLELKNQNLKAGINWLVILLTQNDSFDSKLSVLSVNAPKNQQPYFNLQNGEVIVKLDNRDLTNANLDFSLKVESVKQMQEGEGLKWKASGGYFSGKLNAYNLSNELALIPFFLDSLSVETPPTKDNKELLKLKEKWAREFHGSAEFSAALQAFNDANAVLDLEDVQFHLQSEALENEQYNGNIRVNAKRLALPSEGMQFEEAAVSLPVRLQHYKTYLQDAFCRSLFKSLCEVYLTQETRNQYDENQLKAPDLSVDGATLTALLNTYPETKAYPIELNADGVLNKALEEKQEGDIHNFLFNHIEGSLNLAVNKALIDGADEKTDTIKAQSPFWQLFRESVKPQGELSQAFVVDNDNYVLKLEKNENGYFINGKPSQELENEVEQDHVDD